MNQIVIDHKSNAASGKPAHALFCVDKNKPPASTRCRKHGNHFPAAEHPLTIGGKYDMRWGEFGQYVLTIGSGQIELRNLFADFDRIC
jgi:hypothetical protein